MSICLTRLTAYTPVEDFAVFVGAATAADWVRFALGVHPAIEVQRNVRVYHPSEFPVSCTSHAVPY